MASSSKLFGVSLEFLSFLLLSIGITMLLFDVETVQHLGKESPEFTKAVASRLDKLQRVLSFVLAICSTLVGLCGVVAFCTATKFIITTLLLVVVAFDSVFRIALCVLMLLSYQKAFGSTMVAMSEVIVLYGSYENVTTSQFTKAVNGFAEKELCCGWAGSDASITLYENSTWYKKLTANSDVQVDLNLDLISKKPARLMLPIHCCSSLNSFDKREITRPNVAGYCSDIYDLKKARASGAIHKQDCLQISANKIRTVMFIYSGVHAVVVIINILLATSSIKYFIASVAESQAKNYNSNDFD